MPRDLAQIIKEAFPRLSEISQQVGGNFKDSDDGWSDILIWDLEKPFGIDILDDDKEKMELMLYAMNRTLNRVER